MSWGLIAVLVVASVSSVVTTEPDDNEPSLEVMARSTVYNVGEKKAIFCKGKNTQDIDWYSPSGAVVAEHSSRNNRIYVEKKLESSGILVPLIIHNIQISDSGNWTCKGGELSETINIIVGRKVNISERFTTTEEDEGRTTKLYCEANGDPQPVVHWYKDGFPINDKNTHKYYIGSNNKGVNYLEIRNLSHTDIGEYVCKVTQKLLSHYTDKTVNLNVKHKPVLVEMDDTPIDSTTVKEVYAILNETKNITCSAYANPRPTYKWNKRVNGFDGDEIWDDSVINSEDGRSSVLQLKMYNESYLGEYQCTAKNSKGKQSIIFHVQLGAKPDPPDHVSIVNWNKTHIQFNVSCSTCIIFDLDDDVAPRPENLTLLGYKIEMAPVQPDTPPDWDAAFRFDFDLQSVNDTLFTAYDLPNQTTFHTRVCSKNAAGDSEWVMVTPNPKTSHTVVLTASLTILIAAFIAISLF